MSTWPVGGSVDGGAIAGRNRSFPTLSKHKHDSLGYERVKHYSSVLLGILYIILLCSSVVSDSIIVIITIKIDDCVYIYNDSKI